MTKGSQRLTFGLRLRKRHFLEKKKLRESDGFLQGFLSGLRYQPPLKLTFSHI